MRGKVSILVCLLSLDGLESHIQLSRQQPTLWRVTENFRSSWRENLKSESESERQTQNMYLVIIIKFTSLYNIISGIRIFYD